MIARVFNKGASFIKVCRYVGRQDAGIEVIYLNEVRGHDFEMMARDFELTRSLRPDVSKPVFHGVLDFHPEERPDDRQLAEIAQKYLQGIGLIDTQYAVVKHTQTKHLHLHLVANRIDLHGNPIDNFPEILKSNDVSRQLVAEFGLMPMGRKNLRQTNFDALDNSATRLYAIYRCVQESLPGCQSLDELDARLKAGGIDVRYRIDKESGQRVGVSYRYMGEAFKGKDVDRELSLPRLEERLALQREMGLWEKEKIGLLREQEVREKEERELSLKQQQVQKRAREEDLPIQHQVRQIKIR